MQIRTKLSLYFTTISAILLLAVLLAINILFARHTDENFFNALKERAIVTAQVYLEADEISDSSLQHFKEKYLNTLPDEVIRMYDNKGNPAFIKDSDHHWPKDIIDRIYNNKYLQYATKGRRIVGIRYDDNQGSFVILVSALDKAGKSRKQNLFQISLFSYFIQLLILFFAGRWFAKRSLLPVQKINRQVQQINATDLHLRVDEGKGKDEISELAINFNSLLQRLESSFELQKTFVANASHELRTPLTSIISEVEVANAKIRTTSEYRQVLLSILSEAERLNYIIEGLLSLASTENMISLQTVGPVRIDELLWELQSSFKKNTPPNIVSVKLLALPDDENLLCITANKHLLSIALGNIIRNAFKFSYNQPIDCSLKYTPKGILISITDRGIGIKEEVLKNIFKPFYRSPEATAFEGQGLGLFIAKKIIDLYKGRITIQSIAGRGTTVNILFT